jgi:hypothetical protein
MPTGFIWRGLSEAEAEAQRATYLQAVRDNQFRWYTYFRVVFSPVPRFAENVISICQWTD